MKSSKPNIAIITTVSFSIQAFYKGQIEALRKAGIKTSVICADDSGIRDFLPSETDFFQVDFTREHNPWKDIRTLWQLLMIFRQEQFDIVQYSTPKAALFGSIASFLTRVPLRLYLLWGLYYEGQKGITRVILRFFEKLICLLSTHVLPDSREMVDFIVQQRLTKRSKCDVILNGSACGVDLEQFNPEKWKQDGERIRSELGIPKAAVVIGVFGRLTGDKGVNEIVSAFKQIIQEHDNTFLLVVGRQEQRDKLLPDTENTLNNHSKVVHLACWLKNLIPYYAAIDIFCLPSYREGFPQSPLEAQAMGKPVITTDILGARESIVDNQTGFLIEPKNSKALAEALKKLLLDPTLRIRMGAKGRERVKQMFDSRVFMQAMVHHRLKLLSRIKPKAKVGCRK
ncbi:MAG: glycosyltransferase family 4 protein [Sedimentisphaerales bacterium]